MELKKYKLGELLDVKRGASLAGDYYATEGEYIRLTCGNFDYNNNCFKPNTSKDNIYYTGTVKPEFIMQKDDIITPLTEQAIGLLGSTAKVPESNKYIQSQDVAKIICNEQMLYPNFAFYLISSENVKKQLSAAAQQTKIRHTSPDKIKDCVVWIPDLSSQIKIGDLFSKIDSKIALNRRINTKLETIAKRLYDYWFVQFDFPDANGNPYKSSGGKMVWNDALKREIPEGWEVKSIKEIADTYSGGTPLSTNSSYYENGTIPWINSGEVNEPIIVNTNNFITELGLQNSSAKFYPKNTILVAMYGATAGKVSLLTFEATSNQAICGVISKQNEITYYLFLLLSSLCNHYIKISTGSARNNISQEIVKQTMFCVPNEKTLLKFNNVVTPTFNHIVNLSKETARLTALRDKLLPLLMNGQVEVA